MGERELRKTTLMELDNVICLSASKFLDEVGTSAREQEDLVIHAAAYISNCIARYFNGEEIFSAEEMESVQFAKALKDSMPEEEFVAFAKAFCGK